jgi:ankyrin repeat protein
MLVTHEGHIEIMKLLITNGADINAQSEDGMTAVLVAAAGYIVIIYL